LPTVSPREPVSGRSHLPAAKAACALPDGCVGQASAGESDEFRPAEIRQSPAAKSSSGPAIVDSICNALAAAATENELPIDFFTRLIWQESRFDPTAVSRAPMCASERPIRRAMDRSTKNKRAQADR
jgi:hypothetical protein